MVSESREEQFYVMCLDTAISGPRLIRAWKRHYWIEYCFRILKHLLATGACQVHSEDAYYGHLVLRIMGCFVLWRDHVCRSPPSLRLHWESAIDCPLDTSLSDHLL